MGVVEDLERAYREQLEAIRTAVIEEAAAAYREIDPDDIVASFDDLAPSIVETLMAGQATAQDAGAAYVEAFVSDVGGRPYRATRLDPGVVGTRADGTTSLRDGLAPIGPMILSSIASGSPTPDAIQAGEWFVARYTDAETLAAADREITHQLGASRRVRGWSRMLHGSPCGPCSSQMSGGPGDPFYRHASCRCERVPVLL